ncbi:MAG: ATP-binding cassette domain-containing protein [Propionibacteriaceae bacterium]|jgi:ATPase subunit of ABC transporter with duplicated ATPase domains|nr:ATP-binding cassette domain-containing protein [Propionibacteriaceae bacterium]
MPLTTPPAVVLSAVSFAWPDGDPVLSGLTAAFNAGRTGLIGANGAGKSTLLRLIAGQLAPTAGAITTTGRVGYLPQTVVLDTGAAVADLLGVRRQLDALRAITAGDADPRHFDALGDDWDVEARAEAALAEHGLDGLGLDRPVGRLSGGEAMLAALAGLKLGGAPITLLDEPTNNLDRASRQRLRAVVAAWRGALVVVSHDLALLELMDETAELRAERLTVFGGPYTAYREHLDREQAAAEQALRTAQQTLKAERRQRIEADERLARRDRYGRTAMEQKRQPKIIMNARRRAAQVSAGQLRGQLDDRVEAARAAVAREEERIRRDARIRISLPDPDVPAGRRLAEFRDARGEPLIIQGPQRVALTGRNGIGKTRLLEALIRSADGKRAPDRGEATAEPPEWSLPATAPPAGGAAPAQPPGHGAASAAPHARTRRVGYLPQRLDHLDDAASLIDVVRSAAPNASTEQVRANLARFLFRADSVDRPIGALSGGERFRAALARLLLREPPCQLLVLDEPTNNLDLASVGELVDALAAYHGGLIAVSHDDDFLARLGVDTWLTLDENGLHVGAPPADAETMP